MIKTALLIIVFLLRSYPFFHFGKQIRIEELSMLGCHKPGFMLSVGWVSVSNSGQVWCTVKLRFRGKSLRSQCSVPLVLNWNRVRTLLIKTPSISQADKNEFRLKCHPHCSFSENYIFALKIHSIRYVPRQRPTHNTIPSGHHHPLHSSGLPLHLR